MITFDWVKMVGFMKIAAVKKGHGRRGRRAVRVSRMESDFIHDKIFKPDSYPACFREMWDTFLSFSRFGF